MTTLKQKPDIRQITRLVPPGGNLVQGQSELAIDPRLARAAAEMIVANQNHYSAAEGIIELRRAVAAKIARHNSINLDPEAKPFELLITHGGTGALTALAQQYLADSTTLVFEPYYPYHRRIFEATGGKTETFTLEPATLALDTEALRARCLELKNHPTHPLRAIVVCTPANPTGKILTRDELTSIAALCQEFDLLCIADEVYEHYVIGETTHISMATLPGMWERTITVNSFSKSWNISGWRLGYVYGHGALVNPLVNTGNVFYVCEATPLQRALAQVLKVDDDYYANLRTRFSEKRLFAVEVLQRLGFEVYESGSAFYVWTRIPEGFSDAMELNDMLMKKGEVAGVPASAFADDAAWNGYMRFCIAREDSILESAFGRIERTLAPRAAGAN
jgi:aminotransferase